MTAAEVVEENLARSDDSCALFLRALHEVLERDDALVQCCAIRALRRLEAGDTESKRWLVELLRHADADVRTEAANALGRLRVNEATGSLVATIENDPEGDVRIEAVKALGAMRSPTTLEPLIRCLKEDGYPELELMVDDMEYNACWEVQSQVLNALGELGDQRATQPVIEVLEDDTYEDLQESGFLLLLRLNNDRAREFLLGQLRDGERLARRRAAWALTQLPELSGNNEAFTTDLLHGLSDALLDDDASVRVYAARALGECSNPLAVTPLTMLLSDADAEVRKEATSVLGRLRGREVVAKLLTMLAESDLGLKQRIVQVLGEIGDPVASEPVSALLGTKDPQLLYDVVHALGALGAPGSETTLARIMADQGRHPGVRVQAARALGKILARTMAPEHTNDVSARGTDSISENRGSPSEAEQALAAIVLDEDERVRHAALTALVEYRPQLAMGMLVDLVRGNFEHAAGSGPQQEAASGADTQPTAAAADVPPEDAAAPAEAPEGLRDLLDGRSAGDSTLAAILARSADLETQQERAEASQEPTETAQRHSLRVLAARLLGGLGIPVPQVVQALQEAASEGKPELRREALVALGSIGDVDALPCLVVSLATADRDVRLAALNAIIALGQAPGFENRIAELLDDPEPLVRQRAVRALSTVGAEAAIEHIPRMLDDEDREVCRTALNTLSEQMKSDALTDRIVDLMFRFSKELVTDAASALRRLRDRKGAFRLLEVLNDMEQQEIHWVCIDALAQICAADPTASDRRTSCAAV
jgi:HEAT repeat protein